MTQQGAVPPHHGGRAFLIARRPAPNHAVSDGFISVMPRAPNNAQQRGACKPPAVARSVAAPGQQSIANRTRCCTITKQQAAMLRQPEAADTVLHHSETTVFETAGGWLYRGGAVWYL
ncbi:MAG: hypothetical protein LBD24_01840 [Spirochaetaceae bacterium]|nr:hypothetical protein [Spirochaetaceae bacterium]